MKKVFISFLAAAMTLSAFAAENARVTVRLTSTNATYGNDELELKENSDRTASYESGYDAEKMMSQANKHSVLLYAFVGDQACSTVATDNLDGTVIGFTTNKYDTDYKLVFSNVSGRELKLYDRVLNVETIITNSLEYSFTATAGRVAVNDRFFINLDASDFAYSLTTNEYGWASYSNDVEDVVATVPTGLKIYKGAIAGDVLDLTVVNYIPQSTGVIVKGAPNTEYFFAAGSGSSDFADNDLKPASAWASHTGSIFCLKGDALYEYVGSDMPANKAYLEISGSSAPKRISLRFNEEQGIEDVKTDVKAEKFVENGQIYIRRGNEVFNLQGQIVK